MASEQARAGKRGVLALRVDVVQLLIIGAGIALLASTWRSRRPPGVRTSIDAPAHPRV